MAEHTHITQCRRCGTCCIKGGPALHLADKTLIDEGIIPANCLYTLRKGEMARDPFSDKPTELNIELIKVKGQSGKWTCTFFEIANTQCRIYIHRPAECRALQCWNTAEFAKAHKDEHLTRQHLLTGMAGLWDVIVDHEERCAYAKIKHWVAQLEGNQHQVMMQNIIEAVRYDKAIRNLIVEKGNLDPGMTDFLFGRSLVQTMPMFGIHVRKDDEGYKLIKSGPDYTAHQ
jgi:Fe-S-cluster containining protein